LLSELGGQRLERKAMATTNRSYSLHTAVYFIARRWIQLITGVAGIVEAAIITTLLGFCTFPSDAPNSDLRSPECLAYTVYRYGTSAHKLHVLEDLANISSALT
jgi:hypothetical protein